MTYSFSVRDGRDDSCRLSGSGLIQYNISIREDVKWRGERLAVAVAVAVAVFVCVSVAVFVCVRVA